MSNYNFPKDMLSLETWSNQEIDQLIDLARSFKNINKNEEIPRLLDRKTGFLLFLGPSTRTRASFETAFTRLGAHAQYIEGSNTRLGHGESIADMAKVYSELGDVLCVRTDVDSKDYVYGKGTSQLKELANAASIPVINLGDCKDHPTQGLADLLTLRENPSKIDKEKFVICWSYSEYLRDLSSVQEDLTLFTRFGTDVTVCAPEEFNLDPQVVEQAQRYSKIYGTNLEFTTSRKNAFEGATKIFPRNWRAYSEIKDFCAITRNKEKSVHEKYKKWKLSSSELTESSQECKIMHVLPAFREEEISNELIDSPRSIVFKQVNNKLYTGIAVLHALINRRLDIL